MKSTSSSQRNRFLDVLKGLCMIMILLTHVPWQAGEFNKYLFGFWRDMAVPILMIISGYVYSHSFERNKINTLNDAYLPRNTLPKLIRYTVPFVIFYIAQLFLMIVIRKAEMTPLSMLSLFLQGGVGPGSYYFPVMVQFVFLFPLIHFTVKRHRFKGLLICGVVNALFELLQWGYGMNDGLYRLLIFRYILLIAYGCYLATPDYKPSLPLSLLSLIAGTLFIVITQYVGYQPKIIRFWVTTCYLACLFILPITMLLIKRCHWGFKPLEIVGKASYHIFLAQMFYFYNPGRIYNAIENRWLEMAASIGICLAGGILFYYAESPLTKLILKLAKKCFKPKPEQN